MICMKPGRSLCLSPVSLYVTYSSFVYSSFGYNSSGYSSFVVVPTELTEYTEAYGFIFLESTERIDATRHTTEGTELIACNI